MSDTKTGTLREAIGRALDDTAAGLWMGQRGPGWGAIAADRILALPELAALIADADNWRRATTGDPTEPEPLAMQARDLLVKCRELEATVARVRALLAAMDPVEVALGGLMYVHGEVARALDGEPQP